MTPWTTWCPHYGDSTPSILNWSWPIWGPPWWPAHLSDALSLELLRRLAWADHWTHMTLLHCEHSCWLECRCVTWAPEQLQVMPEGTELMLLAEEWPCLTLMKQVRLWQLTACWSTKLRAESTDLLETAAEDFDKDGSLRHPVLVFEWKMIFILNTSIIWISWLWQHAPSTRRWCECSPDSSWGMPESLSKNLWDSKELKSSIQTWPLTRRWPRCCLQACSYTLESTWFTLRFVSSLTMTSFSFDLTVLTIATPSPYFNAWDKAGSLKRLSLGRCWPRTAAWTNFVSTSDGLWWVPTFSSDMIPSLRTSWIHRCLSSICFDFLEIPSLDAIVFPAYESVLRLMTVILTSCERIADLNSWMIWYWSLCSACRCNSDWEQSKQWPASWSPWSLISCPIRIWIADDLNWSESLSIWGWNLRLHDEDEVLCLIDML